MESQRKKMSNPDGEIKNEFLQNLLSIEEGAD
jgi:hypothetical protein